MGKTKAMGDFKNLNGAEGIEKMRKLVDAQKICLFTSRLDQQPLATRPMGTQEVDGEGRLWFLSRADSEKNLEIEKNDKVQLFYANNSSSEYLSVYGEAQILTDQEDIDEHWMPIAKAWFHEGKKDPAVSVICVTPLDAYYWDTKSNKAVSLIKIMASALTGTTADDGIEGKIRL